MNIPATANITLPAPLTGTANVEVTFDGAGAPATPATGNRGWLIPALIGAALVIAAIIFWPREHAVPPTQTTTTTVAPAPAPAAPAAQTEGYSPLEKEADEAADRARKSLAELKNM